MPRLRGKAKETNLLKVDPFSVLNLCPCNPGTARAHKKYSLFLRRNVFLFARRFFPSCWPWQLSGFMESGCALI